jgi:hypothetical protein
MACREYSNMWQLVASYLMQLVAIGGSQITVVVGGWEVEAAVDG